jgi:hypothetical protein
MVAAIAQAAIQRARAKSLLSMSGRATAADGRKVNRMSGAQASGSGPVMAPAVAAVSVATRFTRQLLLR